jgi:hypothetical protein
MRRALSVVAVAGLVLVLTEAGHALGSIPDIGGVIHACYSPGSGRLRVIDTGAGQVCRDRESTLEWNQTGPPGPPGGVLKVTTLKTTAQDVDFAPTDALFHERLTLGTFTKDSSSSRVHITWQGPAWIEGHLNGTCTFELRVDGAADNGYTGGGFGTQGGNAVLWLNNGATFNEGAINDSTYFDGLSAGPHVITVWVRGTSDIPGADTCFINPGVFVMTTDVEELA